MDRDAGGYRARDAVAESQELLVAMPTGVLADDRAVEHGQGGKQRRRAVAPGIMCHGGAAAFLQRQAGLCAVAGLTVRPVIDRQHDRVSRRRNGEADDVGQRLEAGGIVRKRERPPAVRHQAMRLPDPRSGTPTAFAIARSVQWVAGQDTVLRLAGLSHDGHPAEPVVAQKTDARPPDVLLRALRVRDNRFKAMPVA